MKKISKIIGSVLITAAAVCLGIGVYQFTKEQNAGKGYQDLSEEVKKEPEDEGSKSKVDIPIDFAALKEKNPDVYAWISIPGTAIDYPVLQRENDNTYYLDHTIDHEEKTEGAIFTENYNNTDFEDPNTVIYGHDMRNGSMFKGLLDYRDKTFFDQNKEVLIYAVSRCYEDGTPYFVNDPGIHVLVTGFQTEERGGETGDFYYTLELTEYRDYSPLTVQIQTEATAEKPATATTEQTRSIPKGQLYVGMTATLNGKYFYSSYDRPYPVHVKSESGGALGWCKKGDLQGVDTQ